MHQKQPKIWKNSPSRKAPAPAASGGSAEEESEGAECCRKTLEGEEADAAHGAEGAAEPGGMTLVPQLGRGHFRGRCERDALHERADMRLSEIKRRTKVRASANFARCDHRSAGSSRFFVVEGGVQKEVETVWRA